jgi:hypothetical protein
MSGGWQEVAVFREERHWRPERSDRDGQHDQGSSRGSHEQGGHDQEPVGWQGGATGVHGGKSVLILDSGK